MKKLLLFFFVINIVQQESKGQLKAYSPIYDAYENMPKSPQASPIFSFSEFKTDLSTGSVVSDFLLCELESGNIKIPLRIRFNPWGLRVDEAPTSLGLGWSLSATGSVNQSIKGIDDLRGNDGDLPDVGSYISPSYANANQVLSTSVNSMIDFFDFQEAGITNNDNYKQLEAQRFLGRIADSWFDGEADEFSFSTPMGGGSFTFDYNTNTFRDSHKEGHNIITHPTVSPYSNMSEAWQINTADGIEFEFAQKERFTNPLYFDHTQIPSTNITTGGSINDIKFPIMTNTWYLSRIHDTRTNKEVDFQYNASWKTKTFGTSYSVSFGSGNPRSYAGGGTKNITREGDEVVLDKIVSEKFTVDFVYNSISNPYGPPLLDKIIVKNEEAVIIKSFQFYYSGVYPVNNAGNTITEYTQALLRKVVEVSNTNAEHDLYQFEYFNEETIPLRFINAQDKHGYYNGVANNISLVPMDELTIYNCFNPPVYGGNRVNNFSTMINGALKKVKYPTGGYVEFLYEQNNAYSESLPGFRISRIKYKVSEMTDAFTKEFEYSNDAMYISPKFMSPLLRMNGMSEELLLNFSSQSFSPSNSFNGCPVYYSKVKEKSTDNNAGYKQYTFDVPEMDLSETAFPYVRTGNLRSFNLGIIDTKIYNAANQLIAEESNEGGFINDKQDYVQNVLAGWSKDMGMLNSWAGNDPYSIMTYPILNNGVATKYYNDYFDKKVPVEITSKQYANGEILENNISRSYDPVTGNVREETNSLSDGSTRKIKIKYSNNYQVFISSSDSWNDVIEQTLNSFPIEISVFEKRADQSTFQLIKSTLYNYQNNNVKAVYELEIKEGVFDFTESVNTSTQFIYDSRYTKKFEVLSFDINYNPTLVKDNKKSLGYFYDYNNSYATAVVENASSLNDIAYSSFETTATGSWSYAGTVLEPTFTITGKKAYNLSTGNITKTGINNAVEYIVSYWSDNGAKSVSGFSSVAGRTINGFTHYEHKINGVSGITISGTGNIDELRLHPVNARMTSQTYIPLIGISAQCDANNRISYYEYDSFNRLSLIRDQDGNVLKKYCYNYAGQAEDCNSPCPSNSQPTWQNTGNVRCQVNSSCGYTGYQEIEQENVNTCLTSIPNQWVLGPYNPTACATSPYTQVDVVNNSGTSGLYIKYTAVNSPYDEYIFSIPASSGPLGCIPGGKSKLYNIQVYHPGFPPLLTYTIGGTTVSGTPANFNGIWIGPLTKTLTINYDF
jgi:hypothetical protein